LLPSTSTALIPDDQIREFQTLLGEIKDDWAEIKILPTTCKGLHEENCQLKQHVTDVRRLLASRGAAAPLPRTRGFVSDECAPGAIMTIKYVNQNIGTERAPWAGPTIMAFVR